MSIMRFVFLTLIIPSLSQAGAVITYHGRILDAQKRPVENSSVSFRVRVYSPNPKKCLLYEEVRVLNMTGSQGIFVIPIGDGNGARTAADPGLTLEKVFVNDPNITYSTTNTPKLVCNTGDSYTSDVLDHRHLEVSFDDNSGMGAQALPLMDVNFVPFSVHAYNAQNIGGSPANSVLRVNGGAAAPLSPAHFSELMALITGASLQYEKSGKLNGSNVPSLTNGQVLGWSGGGWSAVTPMTSYTETDPTVQSFAKSNLPACSGNSFLQNDGLGNFACVAVTGLSGGTVKSIAAGTGLVTDQPGNAAITDTGTVSVDVGTTAGKIVQLETGAKLPAVDGSQLTNVNAATATTASGLTNTVSINTSGTITASQMTTSGDIISTGGNIQTNKALTAKDGLFLYDEKSPTPGSVGLKAPADVPISYVLTLPVAQGTNGQVLGMSPSTGQLSWINPSSGSVTSVTADLPLSVDSSNAASPKVSMPAASAAQDGYLKKEDFTLFNDKADSSDPRFTDSRTPSGAASGDLGNSYPNPSVEKLKGQSLAGTASTTGQVLRFDSGSWVPSAVKLSELAGASGLVGSAFNVVGCTAAQTMVWSSLTDQFSCQDISLPAGKVAGLATVATTGSYTDLSNKPTIPTCGANQYLTYNGTSYTCANDAGASGTVASVSSGTTALKFSSPTGTITATVDDATTSVKGLVQLAADGDSTAGTVVQADDSRLTNSRAPTGAASGDLTGNYPAPTLNTIVTAGTGTKITYDAKGRVTASTALSDADIPVLDWTKITTGKPTTLSGYGITDAVKNNGSGAGNVITSIQSGNTAGRPGASVDGRLYIDTQAGVIYRDNGTSWIVVSSSSGTGISALTGDVTASGTGSVAATVNKVNGVTYPSAPATNTVPVVTGANTITYQTVPLAAGGTGATTQAGAANNILPSQGSNAGKVLQTNGTDVSWVTPNAGTVTSVTAGAPLTSSGGATPNITIPKAASGVDGYLSGTDWATFNTKLGTTLNSGLVWVGNGSNTATARTLKSADINSTFGGAWFTASGLCANGTSLQYVSASDTVSCQAYALTSSQVTTALGYTPANGSSYVLKAGDTMTGPLHLPAGTATANGAPLKLAAGSNLTTPEAGAIEFDGTNLYFTDSTPARKTLAVVGNAIPLVRVATTGNITLSGTQTVDGVALSAGDRVLVQAQTTASQNGVYIVAAGAWLRVSDMSTWSQTIGYQARVSSGNTWAGMTFNSMTVPGGTLDTTPIVLAPVGISGASYNIAIGSEALKNTSGSENIAIGHGTMSGSSVTGYSNTAVGLWTMGSLTSGVDNAAFGYQVLFDLTSGGSNTAIGHYALSGVTTGNENTALGLAAGNRVTGASSRNVFIGFNAGPASNTVLNDTLWVANNSGTPLIYGDFATQRIGIAKTNPTYALDVVGDVNVTGNFKINGVNISSGGVTNVSSVNGDITVANGSSTPVLTLNSGTAAGQIPKLDGSGKLLSSMMPSLSSANLTNDSDLLKASNMPANCAATQTLTFSSPTGTWVCSNIANLDASVIATGTIAAARLPASATYWEAATGGINYAGGNVGVGVGVPTTALDVAGWITSRDNLTAGYVYGSSGGVLLSKTATYGKPALQSVTSSWTGETLLLNPAGGNIGVGTIGTVTAKLQVNGDIVSTAFNAGASVSIDWSKGNSQYTSANCGAFTMSNMSDGGMYTLAIQGTSAGTCSFTHSGLTIKMPPDHSAIETGKDTIYTFLRMGTKVYVNWNTGY